MMSEWQKVTVAVEMRGGSITEIEAEVGTGEHAGEISVDLDDIYINPGAVCRIAGSRLHRGPKDSEETEGWGVMAEVATAKALGLRPEDVIADWSLVE
jgi:hypothetical protein